MHRTAAAAATLLLHSACRSNGPDGEQPAGPDPLVVTLGDGEQLRGPEARLDVRFPDPEGPAQVELFLSGAAASGAGWSALLRAGPELLERRAVAAAVTQGPLQPGQASVERRAADGAAQQAASGQVQLRLEGRRLAGEVGGAPAGFAARVEGPFVVTCSVPLPGAPAGQGAVLTVDARFESAQCRPWGALAGR
jgi:hypothetical protein